MSLTRYDLGQEGEKLVASWFKKHGFKVSKSEDQFDDRKDLLINDETVEVKTQTIYRKFPYFGETRPAFTISIIEDTKIHRNQLNKCLNVEHLIFVSRSSHTDLNVRIYEAPPLGERYFTIIQNKKDGRFVAGFPISEMKQIGIINDKEIVDKFMDDWRSY